MSNNQYVTNTSAGISIFTLITAILVFTNLTGHTDISWWFIIFLPILGPIAVFTSVLLFIGVLFILVQGYLISYTLIAKAISNFKNRKKSKKS